MTHTPNESRVVYRNIPRLSADMLASLRGLTVADIHDALPAAIGAAGLLDEHIHPMTAGQRLCGQAVIASCVPGDSLMSHCALYVARPGDVLVLSDGGVARGAIWGGTMTLDAKAAGLAGAIVDGPIRDVEVIRELRWPVWARSVSAARAEKAGQGAVNTPLTCGGSIVNPGDIVIADDDGVLVFPPEYAATVVATVSREREKRDELRRRIANGERIFDILHFEDLMKEKDITFKDGPWHP